MFQCDWGRMMPEFERVSTEVDGAVVTHKKAG